MRRLAHYFGHLRTGKITLWCYLIWYLAMLRFYFDPRPSLWINSLGISVVIGTGLILSVMPAGGPRAMEKWAVARLFLIFSPSLGENAIAAAACVMFIVITWACRAAVKAR